MSDIDDLLDSPVGATEVGFKTIPIIPADGFDPRIKQMSYSSNLTLHACPRKYQLYKLKATDDPDDPDAASNQNITFAFGHIVGEGIQDVLDGIPEEKVIWSMFLGWHANLADRNDKQNKSFYLAVLAIQRFISLRNNGFLDDYELLQYNGKPAKELSFRISLPDDFKYRGSVDAVLKHKISGKILVLECKTSSSANLNPTTFKNSAQAVGYSVVLDVIAPEISSYDVLYLVYLTKDMAYEQLKFVKTYLQRATWIQELLLDVESIKLYQRTGVYPMRGESCNHFFRDCEYLNQCTLSTELITVPYTEGSIVDGKLYDVEITLEQLIEGQLKKVIQPGELLDAIPQDGDEML
jgi:hypothetical protein